MISASNLSKRYLLYDSPLHRLKEAFHPFRKKYHHEFTALDGVSFEVKQGETVGILGRNGSGKSTLLQLICGILQPTSGQVSIRGRVSALLELGAGFNPEFTGRSNVYMNGFLLGFTRAEIDSRMADIERFAEIGEFIDQPMKTYSSGMYVRLAFACAINVQPDILVVDEALSVGDVFFQQKCYAHIRKVIAAGTTCLFVSHDTQAVMNICSRAILLDRGRIDFDGPPEVAVSRYFGKLGTRPAKSKIEEDFHAPEASPEGSMVEKGEIIAHSILKPGKPRQGGRGIEIVAARVIDGRGLDTLEVQMLEPLQFQLLLRGAEAIRNPFAGIHFHDRLGNLVFASSSRQQSFRLPDLQAGKELVVIMEVEFRVQPGEYTFSLGVGESAATRGEPDFLHDRWEQLGPILVTFDKGGELPFFGIVQLPFSVSCTAK